MRTEVCELLILINASRTRQKLHCYTQFRGVLDSLLVFFMFPSMPFNNVGKCILVHSKFANTYIQTYVRTCMCTYILWVGHALQQLLAGKKSSP
jgi:hypothetical protein